MLSSCRLGGRKLSTTTGPTSGKNIMCGKLPCGAATHPKRLLEERGSCLQQLLSVPGFHNDIQP